MKERLPDTSFTLRWFLQAGLGILLIVLLGVHLLANHWLVPSGLLGYEDIIHYFDIPGVAWMELSLLIVVTVHSLLGIHSILLDLNLPFRLKMRLSWLLIVLGLVAILYGFRLTWLITAR